MNDTVHIVTCISYDTTLLRHFFEYYQTLGVQSFHIAIDEQVPGIWEETARIAADFDIKINLFSASARQRSTGLEANNKEESRLQHVPRDDWFIPADLDEFIQFPAPLSQLVKEMQVSDTTFLMGRFVDRISRTGVLTLTQKEVSSSIWDQYPLECEISKLLLKCWCHKVILCRGDCELASGHHNVIRPARPMVSRRGVIHHFKWRAGIFEALERRIELYVKAGYGAYKESERALEYLKLNGRFLPDDFKAREGWDPNFGPRVIYTAITGKYDSLKEQDPWTIEDAGMVAFVDRAGSSTTWRQQAIHDEFKDPCRNAKFHKTLPHRIFPKAEYSLWIDGSIHLKDDFRFDSLVETYLASDDIAVFKHSSRKCPYAEAAACILQRKDDPEIILKQMERYRYESFPEGRGLAECPVILRRHSEKIQNFNEVWWDEISQHSRRDQLSFNYVCWKLGIRYAVFPGTIHDNPIFGKNNH